MIHTEIVCHEKKKTINDKTKAINKVRNRHKGSGVGRNAYKTQRGQWDIN